MSQALLFKVLDDLAGDEQKALLMQMSKSSLADSAMLYELTVFLKNQNTRNDIWMNGEGMVDFFMKKIKAHPEEDKYYNYLIVSKIYHDDFTLPEVILSKARAINEGDKRSYISSILRLFTEAELSDKARQAKVIDMVEKDGVIELQELMLLFSLNEEVFNRKRGKKIDKKVLDIFTRFYEKNKGLMSNKQLSGMLRVRGQQAQMQQALVEIGLLIKMEFLRGDDYPEIIEAIEAEGLDGGSDLNVSHLNGGHGRRDSSIIELLSSVTELQRFYFSEESSRRGHPRLNKEKLVKHIDLFKNPLLKVLALQYADPKRDVSDLLKEAKQIGRLRLDAHIMHAYVLDKKGELHGDVLRQLSLALKITNDPLQRTGLNAAMMNLGVRISKESFDKLDDTLKEELRIIARRQMLSRKITDAKSIEGIIHKFSMQGEKARYLNKHKGSIRTQVKSNRFNAGGLAGLNTRVKKRSVARDHFSEKLKKALDLNEPERAINLAYKRVQFLLRSRYVEQYELDSFAKKIKKLKLEKALMKRLRPGDSESSRKWLNYYRAARAFDDKESLALAINCLSGMSDLPSHARLSVVMAIYREQRVKALDLLKGDRVVFIEVIKALYSDFRKHNKKPELYIDSIEFLNDYIHSLGEEAAKLLSTTSYVQFMFTDCVKIMIASRSNYHTPFKAIDKANTGLLKRRDKAIKRLYLEMMRFNQYADNAFKAYMSSFSSNSESSLNKVVLAIVKKSLLATASFSENVTYQSGLFQQDFGHLPTRLEYLFKYVLFKQDPGIIDDDFISSAENVNKVFSGKLLLYKKLLLANEGDLVREMKGKEGKWLLSDLYDWLILLKFNSKPAANLLLVDRFLAYFEAGDFKLVKEMRTAEYLDIQGLVNFTLKTLSLNNKHTLLLDMMDRKMANIVKSDKRSKSLRWKIISKDGLKRHVFGMTANCHGEGMVRFLMHDVIRHARFISGGVHLAEKYQYPIGLISSDYNEERFLGNEFIHLSKAGFLGDVEDIILTKMPVYNIEKNMESNRNAMFAEKYDRYVKSLSNLLNSVNKQRAKYTFDFMALSYKQDRTNVNDIESYKALIVALKKADEKLQYGAGLMLTLMGEKTFFSFVSDYEKSLKKASKEHLKALSVMFKIDESAKYQGILKSKKLDSLFSIEEKILK